MNSRNWGGGAEGDKGQDLGSMVPHRVLVDGHEEEGLGQRGGMVGVDSWGQKVMGRRKMSWVGRGDSSTREVLSPPLHKALLIDGVRQR